MSNQGFLPKEIAEYCLDFEWDNEKVWQVKAPVETMAMKDLEWQFSIPFWHVPPNRYVLTPNEVMDDPKRHPAEYERIMKADLSHPLDVMQNRKGLWEILDGLHRLAKMRVLGQTEVMVRKIPPSEIPNIKPDQAG